MTTNPSDFEVAIATDSNRPQRLAEDGSNVLVLASEYKESVPYGVVLRNNRGDVAAEAQLRVDGRHIGNFRIEPNGEILVDSFSFHPLDAHSRGPVETTFIPDSVPSWASQTQAQPGSRSSRRPERAGTLLAPAAGYDHRGRQMFRHAAPLRAPDYGAARDIVVRLRGSDKGRAGVGPTFDSTQEELRFGGSGSSDTVWYNQEAEIAAADTGDGPQVVNDARYADWGVA